MELDEAASLTMAGRIVERPLLAPGVFIRHNPAALAAAIMEIVASNEVRRQDTELTPLVFDCDDFNLPLLSGGDADG